MSRDIAEIFKTAVKPTIDYYMSKYAAIIENRIGMTADDVTNEMNVEIWKAVLSYCPNKKANIKTYTKRLVKNRFKSLLRQSKLKKYNSLTYFSNVFESPGVDPNSFVDESTGESFFEKRNEFHKTMSYLSEPDRIILSGLMEGHDFGKLAELTGKPVIEITAALNRICHVQQKLRDAK